MTIKKKNLFYEPIKKSLPIFYSNYKIVEYSFKNVKNTIRYKTITRSLPNKPISKLLKLNDEKNI